MITVFALKPFTGDPADGIDNVNIGIFGNVSEKKITYLVEVSEGFKGRGAIRRIDLGRSLTPRFLKKVSLIWRMCPDYLWGNGSLTELPFVLLKPRRTKYVIGWHTVLLKKSGAWKVRTPWFLRKLVFLCSDFIIAVSEFSAGTVRAFFPEKKIFVIVNGVDTGFFSPLKKNPHRLEEKYHIDFSKPVVSFVGTLQPRKRPDLIIDIAKELPKANFVFVGNNTAPWHYDEEIKRLPNAQWVQAMPREDVAVLLASSSVFIFPSLRETCAAVIVEAMASGVPVITSRSGGNGEMIIDGESGFLIDPEIKNEREVFMEKLNLLLKDSSLQSTISEAARRRAENHFSWKNVAARYESFLGDNSKF